MWLLRLRAQLARARGDEAATETTGIATATWRSRCFEGHIEWAEAMP